MEYAITFGHDGVVRIRTRGEADVRAIQRYLQELVADPRWVPGMPCLVDHREVDLGKFSTEDVGILAREVGELADRLGAGRNATVVSGTVDFGLARMWELRTDDRTDAALRIFTDPDEALRWLLEED